MKNKKTILLALLAAVPLLLCGCTRYIQLGRDRFLPETAEYIEAVLAPGETETLSRFPELKSVELSGSDCYEEIEAWAKEHGGVAVNYTLSFPGGITAGRNDTSLDLSALPHEGIEDAFTLLGYMSSLGSVRLPDEGAGFSLDDWQAFAGRFPEIEFEYGFELCGKTVSVYDTAVDLSALRARDIHHTLETLSYMPRLTEVDLGKEGRRSGGELSWTDIHRMQALTEGLRFQYAFTLYGKSFRLTDTKMDLNHIPIDDRGKLVRQVIACMPSLSWLCMDSCGVSSEDMAAIRDDFPEIEVVWRIWFAKEYSVRTDVEKILASIPSRGGTVTNAEAAKLKYCTKVKYLDLGHNGWITDLSFVEYMPELEVLIIAMNKLGDLTPLASCKKLEYLEMFFSDAYDLTPLAGLTELRHLNMGMCYRIKDITPLYSLPNLERLYIGHNESIPHEQIEEIRRLMPDCEINDTDFDTSVGYWRYRQTEGEELEWFKKQPYYRDNRSHMAPRFALLRDQFGYDTLDYSFKWLDPNY